ncbi:uncharacterized protein LOC135499944 [Lineus longissimus]|uniref:uncharacterized protein LOC135499944 n=1 Tax=Lineus longissimus TaxID=88925 RepID=UPI00315D7C65
MDGDSHADEMSKLSREESEARFEIVELQIELEHMVRSNQIETQMREMTFELEKLRLEREIKRKEVRRLAEQPVDSDETLITNLQLLANVAVASTTAKTTPTDEDADTTSTSRPPPEVSAQQNLDPQAPVFKPTVENSHPPGIPFPQVPPTMNPPFSEDQFGELIKMFAGQITIGRLPPPEPTVFSGDPLMYPAWKAAFHTLIEGRGIPKREQIHYLRRYLSGPAKEAIEGYLYMDTEEAYIRAKEVLEKRFGEPFVVADAFRKKLESWPKVGNRDGTGLRKLSDFLQQCNTAMSSIGYLSILDDCRENRKILAKLPDWLVSRWGRKVSDYKLVTEQFPPFRVFADFMSREADISCDPITSLQSLHSGATGNARTGDKPTTGSSHGHEKRSHEKMSSLATETTEPMNSHRKSTMTGSFVDKKKCVCCEEVHMLDDCPVFLAKTLEDRKQFVKANRLCFSCMKKAHQAKDCKRRSKCKKCERTHPTALHDETRFIQVNSMVKDSGLKEDKTERASVKHSGINHVGGCDSASVSKSSMIVPVWVSHEDRPEYEILSYAMLDTQSDTTFVLENTRKTLGLVGTKSHLSLSTMSRENEIIETVKVKGLVVRGMNSDLKINLPPSFSRDVMPMNREHIPTPEIANVWPHLTRIASELPPLQDCNVALLIGYNCPQALAPREVIALSANAPYAQRTDLGWGIVGTVDPNQIDMTGDNIGVSHRIVTYGDKTSAEHCQEQRTLVMPNRIKEIITILESDFKDADVKDSCGPQSYEDKKFMGILDAGIVQRADGHYEMPLPFKGNRPELPESRGKALRRLNQLKLKLNREPAYRDKYVAFMQRMIDKGDAELVPLDAQSSKEHSSQHWYVPHFGVVNAKKPDKVRVVFDCQAECAGHSINKHLLQGPDLTNSLLGVLCRFRQETVAITCDVEQMFHQFKVAEEDRDYLRFLWWSDGKLDEQPKEYRMTVHLFGGTSSPSCCNFGFKRLADDYEAEYGHQAADFIRDNFYVDDGLTSLPSDGEVIHLLENTQKLCKEGGLHLHKINSNSDAVIQSVAEKDRAAKNSTRLLTESNNVTTHEPTLDRALGIYTGV